jgi:flagellar basal body-associated protein FliL
MSNGEILVVVLIILVVLYIAAQVGLFAPFLSQGFKKNKMYEKGIGNMYLAKESMVVPVGNMYIPKSHVI